MTVGRPKALAFYLPQYHPIPENDEWWGTGFTEWHNVTRARPLFDGHYQPHLPGELGFYDLRVPEVREAQAELARTHGVHGFVYYHYWFKGRRLLERPFGEVLKSGQPNFPFALCWANEEWTRGWDSQTGHVLMRQEFSEQDDRAHIRYLIEAFKDPRYITIDGRPLMLIYRPTLIPDLLRTSEIWRTEVQRAGFPDLYLCWVESWGAPPGGKGPEPFGLDASVGFMPVQGDRLHPPLESLRGHRILDYESAAEWSMGLLDSPWKRFPSVMVGWDNTARRARGATIYHGATPERYEHWLKVTADAVTGVRAEENYLFILAWNEWAEGNHLEPDQRYGRAFLEATRSVLVTEPDRRTEPARDRREPVEKEDVEPTDVRATPRTSPLSGEVEANVGMLLRDLPIADGQQVVDLMDGATRRALRLPGHRVAQGTLADATSVKAVLDGMEQPGAILLVDVLQHFAEPQELLDALSTWSRSNGCPPLVIATPNVTHVDMAFQMIAGRFDVQEAGVLEASNLRFFSEETLQRLVERSGWRLVDRQDLHALFSEAYDDGLRDALPEELVGALQTSAQALNPNWSVAHFVWVLEPQAVELAPNTYEEAVAPATQPGPVSIDPEAAAAVSDYLASVGLLVSEMNRRTVAAQRAPSGPPLSPSKQLMLKIVYGSPRRAAAFQRVYNRFR
jgi:Glycosyltransferase WbsX